MTLKINLLLFFPQNVLWLLQKMDVLLLYSYNVISKYSNLILVLSDIVFHYWLMKVCVINHHPTNSLVPVAWNIQYWHNNILDLRYREKVLQQITVQGMYCNGTGSVIDLDIELWTYAVYTVGKTWFAVLNTLICIMYRIYRYTAIALSPGYLDVIVTAPTSTLTVRSTRYTSTFVSCNYVPYVRAHPANDYIV